MPYKHVLFDLDGTLCDPGPGITNSVQYALGRMGLVETDQTTLRRFVGPPLIHSFVEYGLDDEQSKQAVQFYRDRFSTVGIKSYRVYQGIPDLLDKLHDQGTNEAVATSKIESYTREILNMAKIIGYFSFIACNEPDNALPKAATIALALNNIRPASLSEVVMIGDKEHDVIGAKANGIDSIGVCYGYGTREEHEAAGATYIVEDVQALEGLLLSNTASA